MSKYPVTNAKFIFQITLEKNEKFVRLYAGLQAPATIKAEIWLPQTYPLTKDSQIISHQKKRRVRDPWVYQGMIKDKFVGIDMSLDADSKCDKYKGKGGVIIGFPTTPLDGANLDYPLQWPNGGGGILYDYPERDGRYHAVSYGDGRGCAYVSREADSHYTKLWGWGDPKYFNRTEELTRPVPLAAGRPKTEYYEPWGSAFNTAFFEPHEFTQGPHGWKALIVPIESGLDANKSRDELIKAVDEFLPPDNVLN